MRSQLDQEHFANGLCLCVLHHRRFDRGAIGLSDHKLPRLLVSEHLHGSGGLIDSALRYRDSELAMPIGVAYRTRREFVHWHSAQVFRKPALEIPEHD